MTYSFDSRRLPPANVYYLQVEVNAFDGQRCAVWWGGHLPGNTLPLPPDAGSSTGTTDGGYNPVVPTGCGCNQLSTGLPLIAALGLTRLRRRPFT